MISNVILEYVPRSSETDATRTRRRVGQERRKGRKGF